MKSFNEATDQVAGLMAAIGGSVDAYEDDKTSSAPAAAISNFDAALASVEANIQYNEPRPASVNSNADQVLAAIEKMHGALDEVSKSPFELDPTEEELFELTPKETEVTAKLQKLIPDVDCEDRQPDGTFWDSILNDVYLPQVPKPVEPSYKFFSSVYADGCEELMEIYQAFTFANRTGEPQIVTLDSGTYEMTQGYAGKLWELNDTGKGRRYVQEAVGQQASADRDHHYDLVEENDIFLWVIPEDRSDGDDLGYLHNQWVFLRE